MPWIKSDLLTPIPKAITDALAPVSTLISQIQAILAPIKAFLDAAKIFVALYADPFVALVTALINQLEEVINDFFGSGIFMLTITPFSFEKGPFAIQSAVDSYEAAVKKAEADYKKDLGLIGEGFDPVDSTPITGRVDYADAILEARNRYNAALDGAYNVKNSSLGRQYDSVTGFPLLSAADAIQAAIDSLSDTGDPNRPQFSNSADIAAFGFLITFPSIQQFIDLLKKLRDVFHFPGLDFTINLADRYSDIPDYYVWFNVNDEGSNPNLFGRQGIEVALDLTFDQNQIVKAIADTITQTGAFSTKVDSPTRFTITSSVGGVVDNAPDPGTTSFTVTITHIGADISTPDPQVVQVDIPILFTAATLQDSYFLISTKPKTATATNPDWRSLRLNSIDQLALLQGSLIRMLETLKGYLVIPDNFILALINVIEQKVVLLQTLLAQLQNLINAINRVSGVYFLDVPKGVGGNDRLRRLLRDEFLENPCNQTGFTILSLFVGGGPVGSIPVDTIRGLLK